MMVYSIYLEFLTLISTIMHRSITKIIYISLYWKVNQKCMFYISFDVKGACSRRGIMDNTSMNQ